VEQVHAHLGALGPRDRKVISSKNSSTSFLLSWRLYCVSTPQKNLVLSCTNERKPVRYHPSELSEESFRVKVIFETIKTSLLHQTYDLQILIVLIR
jgi:hypothetical protein